MAEYDIGAAGKLSGTVKRLMATGDSITVPGCVDCLSTESPLNCLWNCKWFIIGITGAILMLEIINARRK